MNSVVDKRIKVIFQEKNQGVGGAVISGYKAALADGNDIIVKIDGDGQMDPALIKLFILPILEGRADYTKGNRFFKPEALKEMPRVRLVGNAILSMVAKVATGYWNIFDPANGFTAIHSRIARMLPFEKMAKGYFFESDMLFRLSLVRAVITDIPMMAKYGIEKSNLKISRIIVPFILRYIKNLIVRIFYNYFLRDFGVATLELIFGICLFGFGFWFGAVRWLGGLETGLPASPGTVMLSALPVLMGIQLLLGFLNYDIQGTPRDTVHNVMKDEWAGNENRPENNDSSSPNDASR